LDAASPDGVLDTESVHHSFQIRNNIKGDNKEMEAIILVYLCATLSGVLLARALGRFWPQMPKEWDRVKVIVLREDAVHIQGDAAVIQAGLHAAIRLAQQEQRDVVAKEAADAAKLTAEAVPTIPELIRAHRKGRANGQG
jgi:hypothetical protein